MELVLGSQGAASPPAYRPRQPRATPLYGLVESYYGKVKAVWEERFERTYGFWRGFLDQVVWRYLDCGLAEAGFARVRCDECGAELFVTFSCKTRALCPSCSAKRAAAFAAFLKDELLEDVPHALWSFTIPKMLRPYFLYRRELLGELARAAYETVHELMVTAVDEEGFRSAMVGAIQTFSDSLKWNPHVHGLAPRGGWSSSGEWLPVPYIDAKSAELLFRHKVLSFLKDLGLVTDERIRLLLSWENTGFSVHPNTTVYSNDEAGLQTLAFYMLRAPVSLQRLHVEPNTRQVFYQEKTGHDRDGPQILDPMEFIARVLIHIPEPGKHRDAGFPASRRLTHATAHGTLSPHPHSRRSPQTPHGPSAGVTPTRTAQPMDPRLSNRHRDPPTTTGGPKNG